MSGAKNTSFGWTSLGFLVSFGIRDPHSEDFNNYLPRAPYTQRADLLRQQAPPPNQNFPHFIGAYPPTHKGHPILPGSSCLTLGGSVKEFILKGKWFFTSVRVCVRACVCACACVWCVCVNFYWIFYIDGCVTSQ